MPRRTQHQAPDQKETVAKVMHEFKDGTLRSSSGQKVKNPKQAIAIGLSEAGASGQQSPQENARQRRKHAAEN